MAALTVEMTAVQKVVNLAEKLVDRTAQRMVDTRDANLVALLVAEKVDQLDQLWVVLWVA